MMMMMMMMMQHAASGAKPFPVLQASQNSASEARCGLCRSWAIPKWKLPILRHGQIQWSNNFRQVLNSWMNHLPQPCRLCCGARGAGSRSAAAGWSHPPLVLAQAPWLKIIKTILIHFNTEIIWGLSGIIFNNYDGDLPNTMRPEIWYN